MSEQLIGGNNSSEPKGSKRKNKKTLVRSVGVVLAIIVVLVVLAALYFGWLAVNVKRPNQSVVVQANVCGPNVVQEYNRTYELQTKSADEARSRAQKLLDYQEGVTKLSGFENDATCLYLATQFEIGKKNFEKASKYVSLLTEKAERGQYVDTNLYGLISIKELTNRLNSIKTTDPADGMG